MIIHDFNVQSRIAAQGDLLIVRLSDAEASKLSGVAIKEPVRGSIRLLEGEVTGHHHEIVMDRTDEDEASAIAAAALAVARAQSAARRGVAVLRTDDNLAKSLPWLLRRDLMIGFLHVDGGPVNLIHPEHDTIRLPSGTYYIGRQIESAGAEERIVQD